MSIRDWGALIVSGLRWEPFREFQREMDRLFNSIEPLNALRSIRGFPSINLYDVGDSYVVCVQLPGLGPDDIELTMTGDTLSLRGERKRNETINEDSYRRQERPTGRWSRSIMLPDRVDSARVSASFARGILTVTIPKAESEKPRQITVSSV